MKALKDISVPSIGFGCLAGHELTKNEIKKLSPELIKRLQDNDSLPKPIIKKKPKAVKVDTTESE